MMQLLRLQQAAGGEDGGKHQRYHGHQLDEDVDGGAGGILERIAHGVAHDSRAMCLAALAAVIAVLNELLGVVPCAAGVGHEDGHQHAGDQSAGQHTAQFYVLYTVSGGI